VIFSRREVTEARKERENMKAKWIRLSVRGALALLLALTFTPMMAVAAGKLEGAWNVNVTVRVCPTDQPVATVYRMITFADDGVLQEFAAFFNPLNPALRGPGQGVWRHLANGNYTYDVQFFRLNANFTLAGWNREHREVVVDASGTSYTATGTAEIYDLNGNLLTTGCATETGTRLF
jgi:hypothetical protein